MGVDSFTCIFENLGFESLAQVKHNVVSICFDGEVEEVDFELNAGVGQVLKSQSELAIEDEHFDGLRRNQEFFVSIQELDDVTVGKDHITFRIKPVNTFIDDQHRDEVD